MARHADIIGDALDVSGILWQVHEARPTKHGFDVLIGWPDGEPRGRGGRGVATIITPALARYLTATRLRDVDLPLGRTAVKRLRADLGLKWSYADWWAERQDDLRTLTLEAFCALHGCSIGAASMHRTKITIPRASQTHKCDKRPPKDDVQMDNSD